MPDTRGTFITLEGVDGCGKSTQRTLLAEHLESLGTELLLPREPGGTRISEKIRDILLDPANPEMVDECELLLYESSRAQLTRELIIPALGRGATVICDRYYDSTTAYQAYGRGLDLGMVERANALGSCGLVPDITLVFDLDPELALARATAGGADRLEGAGLEFQKRIRAGYAAMAEAEPERIRIIDASGSPEEVHAQVLAELERAGLIGGRHAR